MTELDYSRILGMAYPSKRYLEIYKTERDRVWDICMGDEPGYQGDGMDWSLAEGPIQDRVLSKLKSEIATAWSDALTKVTSMGEEYADIYHKKQSIVVKDLEAKNKTLDNKIREVERGENAVLRNAITFTLDNRPYGQCFLACDETCEEMFKAAENAFIVRIYKNHETEMARTKEQ